MNSMFPSTAVLRRWSKYFASAIYIFKTLLLQLVEKNLSEDQRVDRKAYRYGLFTAVFPRELRGIQHALTSESRDTANRLKVKSEEILSKIWATESSSCLFLKTLKTSVSLVFWASLLHILILWVSVESHNNPTPNTVKNSSWLLSKWQHLRPLSILFTLNTRGNWVF